MKCRLLVLLAGFFLLVACGRNEKLVPRRDAYPRIETYDSAYVSLDSLPVNFDVNVEAQSALSRKDDGSVWLTISYPRYDAKILLTLSPVTKANVHAVVDNRIERISLNVNTSYADIDEFDNLSGYSSIIVYAPSAVSTPIQFIAAPKELDGDGWVVSGAVFFENVDASASIDSVSPMTETLLRDVRHSIYSIK